MPDEITELPASDSGSPTDWGAWLDANGARLLLYARQQTPTSADAEDVLQDALLQLVRTVECGDGTSARTHYSLNYHKKYDSTDANADTEPKPHSLATTDTLPPRSRSHAAL